MITQGLANWLSTEPRGVALGTTLKLQLLLGVTVALKFTVSGLGRSASPANTTGVPTAGTASNASIRRNATKIEDMNRNLTTGHLPYLLF